VAGWHLALGAMASQYSASTHKDITMKYAIIENGIVVNVVLADAAMGQNWVQSDVAGPGWTYSNGVLAAPVIPTPPAVVDPCEWLIDKGPFFDRFGAAKMDVLTSTDPVIKAILVDIGARHWIDLQRPDVATSLAYVGTVVPAVDAALQTAILTTPVSAADNLALRKLYFA